MNRPTRKTLLLAVLAVVLLGFLLCPSRFSPVYYDVVPTNELLDSLMTDIYSRRAFSRHLRGPNCTLDLDILKNYSHDEELFHGEVTETEEELAERLNVSPGGIWSPRHCEAMVKVLIIVPYREREDSLARFVRLMHPYLQQQLLSYAMLVVEQAPGTAFNRAKLFNVGYVEAAKAGLLGLGTCLIFHDVDLVRRVF